MAAPISIAGESAVDTIVASSPFDIHMTTLAATTRLTADEFIASPERRDYELVDGRLVKGKTMGVRESFIANQIAYRLTDYVNAKGSGAVFGSDLTYQCFGNRDTLRRADVSFIAKGRLPGGVLAGGYATVASDLAVEVVSPHDSAYELQEKVEEYLAAGVRLIWVVYPHTRSVEIHRPGQLTRTLRSGDLLTGDDVLDGFNVSLKDIFPTA